MTPSMKQLSALKQLTQILEELDLVKPETILDLHGGIYFWLDIPVKIEGDWLSAYEYRHHEPEVTRFYFR